MNCLRRKSNINNYIQICVFGENDKLMQTYHVRNYNEKWMVEELITILQANSTLPLGDSTIPKLLYYHTLAT